jgi:hypothetical protein
VVLGGGLNLNTAIAAEAYVITDDLGLGFGHSLTSYGGDLDGDGYDDFVVTRAGEQAAGNISLFTVNGAAAGAGSVDLAGAGGRVTPNISPLSWGGSANEAVIASIRDWDGDGVQDFIVGVYAGDSPDGLGGETIASGAVQIISGVDGSLLTELSEADSLEDLGRSVSGAGDVNGDGYVDFIVGSPGATASGGTDAGKAYLIFGGPTVPTDIGLDTASPTQVHVIDGIIANGHLGRNVQGLGDFNNDGYEDFAISEADNSGIGRVHVVFGGMSPTITLGTTTFTISGVDMGAGGEEIPLLAMGDINGDGIADLGVGSGLYGSTGALHLFFGGAHTAGTYAIGTDDATIITGAANVQIVGGGAVGDFNGDGIDDFGVAMMNTTSDVIDMYVVYGGSLASTMDQTYLSAAANAFHISYNAPAGTSISDVNVTMSAIGDVNGDGFADVGIGIANVDNDLGVDSDGNTDATDDDDGMIAVVYGSNAAGLANVAPIDVSQVSGQTMLGTAGNDTLHQSSGGHTDLVFRGGAGDDLIGISSPSMSSIDDIDGGTGFDSLEFLVGGQTLNFGAITSENFKGIDALMFGAGQTGQTMSLTLQQIFTMIENSDTQTLMIDANGSTGATLQIEEGTAANPGTINTSAGLASALGMTDAGVVGSYYTFHQGDNVLMIDVNLVDSNQVVVT